MVAGLIVGAFRQIAWTDECVFIVWRICEEMFYIFVVMVQ